MSQTIFLFFLPRVVTPCPSTCSPSTTQSSPPPSCFFTPAWTLAAAAAVPPSRSSVVFCMPASGGHRLSRSHSASTVAWSISLKVFTEETHHRALFLTACFAGHSGVASCAFSSDRGTFSALADGSTTVQDAVTTGQMVRVAASRSSATRIMTAHAPPAIPLVCAGLRSRGRRARLRHAAERKQGGTVPARLVPRGGVF